MIALDTSAIMATLLDEPESEVFFNLINTNDCVISAATVVECQSVIVGRFGLVARDMIALYISKNEIEIIDFDAEQVAVANNARVFFGRGTGHPAQLNFGDTFSYALAKTRNIPLLFKGDDFIHTDIMSAISEVA